MNADVERALATDLVIDITTIGRTSGQLRTVEIWFHRVDDRYFITGWPGTRGWYANMLDEPRFVIRFTQSGGVELNAIAHSVTDETKRRRVIEAVYEIEGGAPSGDVDSWMRSSPIIEFTPAAD